MLKPKKQIKDGYYWVLLTEEGDQYEERENDGLHPWCCNFSLLDCGWSNIQKLGRKINKPKAV